jgi:hypothetical protein
VLIKNVFRVVLLEEVRWNQVGQLWGQGNGSSKQNTVVGESVVQKCTTFLMYGNSSGGRVLVREEFPWMHASHDTGLNSSE